MSYAEDIEAEASYLQMVMEEREREWRQGFHETKNHRRMKIADMTDAHLRNAIAYFKGLDVSPLKEELRKRAASK